jgi:hypothetical protein
MEWNWRENRSTRGNSCPSAILSTTNPTWADPGGERPATNRLSHGTAYSVYYVSTQSWVLRFYYVHGILLTVCMSAGYLATFMCRLSRNLGASTFWNPKGLSRPVMGLLYLLCQQVNTYVFLTF